MKKAPEEEEEAGAECFILGLSQRPVLQPPVSFFSLLTPPRGTSQLPPVCAQGQAEIFQSEPYSGQERSLKGNFSGNPNVCAIYLLSVLHKPSQFILFGTKTCALYNLICLLNYHTCYVLEKNKQTKTPWKNYFPSNNFQRDFFPPPGSALNWAISGETVPLLSPTLRNWGVTRSGDQALSRGPDRKPGLKDIQQITYEWI